MQMIGKNIHGSYSVPADSVHRPAARDILNGKVYEPRTIQFMIDNCGHGSIIHAGTYFGDFIPALSKYCKANIYAFEPNIVNFIHASNTIEMNQCRNVILKNNALGSDERIVHLQISENNIPSGGASKVVVNESSQTTPVQQIRLDDVIPDTPISILQLDIELSEADAILGALRIIEENHPLIIVEGQTADDILRTLGYTRTGYVHQNSIWKYLNNGDN